MAQLLNMEEEIECTPSTTCGKRSRDEISLKVEKNVESVNESSSNVSIVPSQSQDGKYGKPPTSRICLPKKEASSSILDSTRKNEEPKILNDEENVLLPKKRISQIRLEAIFYPKFENENRNDQLIRKEMLSKVAASLGYIEVTLKHSGSLILWSGGDRYYSKNSTDNLFTGVGEIMLRQHFAWSWKQQNKNCTNFSSDINNESYNQEEKKYDECSYFVSQRELTLSFEVVTAVLGHHGAVPKRDYLVLTAVADRKTAQFMSSPDLISFAQEFRLPHNDTWLFQSPKSARMLFQLYETSRENGLADNVIPALTKSADGGHVQSIYPHVDFQGNILEGIVIRYVPYELEKNSLLNKSSHSIMIQEKQKQFNQLASQSTQILNLIPRGEINVYNLSKPTILSCSIRDIMRKHFSDSTAFQREIQNILRANDHHDRRILSRAKISSIHCISSADDVNEMVDVPSFIRQRLDDIQKGRDDQTKKIATLLEHLHCFGKQVSYKIFHEKTKQSRFNSPKERWLCIIHVHHDEIFKKYFKQKTQDDMTLFRGFCIRLIFEDDQMSLDPNKSEGPIIYQPTCKYSSISEICKQKNREPLLLKMKFLPYMVRTFICRNGLDILSRSGIKVFNNWAQGLMSKWEISHQNCLKWIHFFNSWAVYAKSFLDNFRGKETPNKLYSNITQIALNQKTYLFHLEYFSKLFDQGKRWDNQSNNRVSTFRGSLFIIGLDDQETEKLFKVFVKKFNILKTINNAKSVQEINILESLSPGSGGFGCYGTVENSLSIIKKLSKNYADAMFVVSHGLTENEINSFVENPNERKKIKNMTLALSKPNYRAFISLPLSCLENISRIELVDPSGDNSNVKANAAFLDAAERIKKASDSLLTPDHRRGLIVFFPCIPGSGKSTLCNFITSERLREKINELNMSDSPKKEIKTCQKNYGRTLVIRSGDEVKEKYWRLVEKEKIKCPSSIYITDKNVPPVSWSEVANICSKTKGVYIPAIPSGPVISTTTLTYYQGKGNGLKAKQVHQYPFSLLFLAICMERVLSRQRCSHSGRLDSGTKDACIIVAKFYSLYRNITAENFREKLFDKFEELGIKTKKATVEFPFLSKYNKTINLPEQLEKALIDAINYHYAIDNKLNAKTEKEGLTANAIEQHLRSLLLRHKEDLRKLASPEIDSKQVFLSLVAREINHLDTEPYDESELSPTKNKNAENIAPGIFSKIVSIDVESSKVHYIVDIMRKVDSSLEKYITLIHDVTNYQKDDVKNVPDNAVENNRFIKNTHVTLAHCSTMSQVEMRTTFGVLKDKTIDIFVNSILFNKKIAAFSVSCASTTSDGQIVPRSKNLFPHITVFCAKGVSANEANELPEAVENGTAKRVYLDKPLKIQGTLNFWNK